MIRILEGDAREVLATLPSESVHTCVTSPPYYGLRDYGVAGQMGLEPTPDEYVAGMVEVFREVRRVLRKDGTLWLNMGDGYATGHPHGQTDDAAGWTHGRITRGLQGRAGCGPGLKPKDLIGIPWLLAFALRADGWYLRSEITWCKRAPMPESVTDRPTTATEKIFLFSKSPRYFYDSEAVREEGIWNGQTGPTPYQAPGQPAQTALRNIQPGSRNMRNFWLLSPEPFPLAHFATFVTEIPRRAILAGTSERGCCPECGAPWARVVERELVNTDGWGKATKDHHAAIQGSDAIARNGQGRAGDSRVTTTGWRPTCAHTAEPVPATVLDPFAGAGTTLLVADRLGRNGIGIELNPTYAAMARNRIANDNPMFSEVVA